MTFITLYEKQYEIRFTYKALRRIEAHYDRPVVEIFSGMSGTTDLELLPVMLWATLFKEPEFSGYTVSKFEDLIEEEIEAGTFNYREVNAAFAEAMQESTIVRQMLGMDIEVESGNEATPGK